MLRKPLSGLFPHVGRQSHSQIFLTWGKLPPSPSACLFCHRTKRHFEIVGLVAAGCLLSYVGGTQLDLCDQGEVCGAVLPDLPHEEGGVHHSQPRVMQLPRASMISSNSSSVVGTST